MKTDTPEQYLKLLLEGLTNTVQDALKIVDEEEALGLIEHNGKLSEYDKGDIEAYRDYSSILLKSYSDIMEGLDFNETTH